MKLDFGNVGSTDGTKYSSIICKSATGLKIKDLLIGGGLIISGILYISKMAYKHGANAFYVSETKALNEVGVLDIDPADLDEVGWTFK